MSVTAFLQTPASPSGGFDFTLAVFCAFAIAALVVIGLLIRSASVPLDEPTHAERESEDSSSSRATSASPPSPRKR